MWQDRFILIFGCFLLTSSVQSWTCTQNNDCSSTVGALCISGSCTCPLGQEMVLGGSLCADRSPYYTWPCFEDHQCSALVTNFECRRTGESQEGNCFCREGFHYLGGRCWPSSDYEAPCERDEHCMGSLRDPFSLSCDAATGTCLCAPGYYRRQWGECRKIANAVGEACVIDEDCQFQNGLCNINTFSCYDSSVEGASQTHNEIINQGSLLHKLNAAVTVIQNGAKASITRQDGGHTRQHGVACDASNACSAPFVCSSFGTCICTNGYYASEDGTTCYAELGSPSTEEQCVGLLAEVRDGICTCMPNFYYEENMRDCVKVARTLSDSCLADNSCHTFGAAVRCGEPVLPWFLRSCECIPELAVWDDERSMCRLFVGVGESCRESSDCLAGNLEIECVINAEGEGICTCPAGTTALDGLCLTTGLQLGDACQASQECTETENTGCYNGHCSCNEGYEETDGFCAPTIGGTCSADSDCLLDNLVCVVNDLTNQATCQCEPGYAEEANVCWPPVSIDAEYICNVSAQCVAAMGEQSECLEAQCRCIDNHHYRDGRCWPQIGLFGGCGRTSECYLADMSERVECRNSLCQCTFDFPYSEELATCTSGATATMTSLLTIVASLFYLLSQ